MGIDSYVRREGYGGRGTMLAGLPLLRHNVKCVARLFSWDSSNFTSLELGAYLEEGNGIKVEKFIAALKVAGLVQVATRHKKPLYIINKGAISNWLSEKPILEGERVGYQA